MAHTRQELRERWTRDGIFPARSPIRRVARAVNAIPMAGRMVLMELAHPAIAAAVNDHDRFRRNPIERAEVTAEAIGDIIHGSTDEAHAVASHLAAVHARVNGPGYRASDPALLGWVAATYFDSVLLATELWRSPLSRADQAEFLVQMRQVTELLGGPSETQPVSLAEFRAQVASTLDELRVTDTATELARCIFWPSAAWRHRPPMATYRLLSFGLLPNDLRTQFGYQWTGRHEHALRALIRTAPHLRPVAEQGLRWLSDGQGRAMRVLMSVGGYQTSPPPAT